MCVFGPDSQKQTGIIAFRDKPRESKFSPNQQPHTSFREVYGFSLVMKPQLEQKQNLESQLTSESPLPISKVHRLLCQPNGRGARERERNHGPCVFRVLVSASNCTILPGVRNRFLLSHFGGKGHFRYLPPGLPFTVALTPQVSTRGESRTKAIKI